MKIAFIDGLKLNSKNTEKLQKVTNVIEEYAAQGYSMTLRQLYYQLVTKNIIANNDREYDKLSSLLTKGRMGGLIDWNALEDRIRQPKIAYSVNDPEHAVIDAIESYRLDRMKEQDNYIELWVEKDALSNVLSRRTNYYHIRLMVNRGYSSTTAMYDSYKRLIRAIIAGKNCHIVYLGDHDPSGLDMVRDIYERLFLMLSSQPRDLEISYEDKDKLYYAYIEEPKCLDDDGKFNYVKAMIFNKLKVHHIALTSEQVKEYAPPPNPAKLTDPRADWYISKFGQISWEVDALNPATLHQIINEKLESLIDMNKFNLMIEKEKSDKIILEKLPTMKTQVNALAELINIEIPKKATKAQILKILNQAKEKVNLI